MNGQHIGYIRVSTFDQKLDRQLVDIKLDKVFSDKCSGKDKNRPGLTECLSYLREGDTLHVHSIDRLARNVSDLCNIVKDLTDRGVTIIFEKNSLTFSKDSSNPCNTLMLSVLGAVCQFERDLIRERQQEGIELAKKRGVYLGRKPMFNREQIDNIISLYRDRIKVTRISKKYNVSRQTIYNILNEHYFSKIEV